MNITIISTTDKGGAGYASKNLFRGLQDLGQNVIYLSLIEINERKGESKLCSIYKRWQVRKNILKNYSYLKDAPQGYDYFTFPKTGYYDIVNHPAVVNADIINIHWIANMIDYPSFFSHIKKPIIWTLHDANPFTGGCHYTFSCNKFLEDCINCPQLSERVRHDAAYNNLKIKKKSLDNVSYNAMIVVSPSIWLKDLSKKSIILKKFIHTHIPYGIETNYFKYSSKEECRKLLDLPLNSFIILFVGSSLDEYRKGFDSVLKVKDNFLSESNSLFLAVGNKIHQNSDIVNLGYIDDKTHLACVYNAADVFFIPSREDNLPNTLLEALCCGTPVIGYRTGGIVDVIDHGKNGFITNKDDVDSVVYFLKQLKNNFHLFNRQLNSLESVKKYSIKRQANSYLKIIRQLLE